MLLVYDHDNVLHITNERGLRWNYDKADKPSFGFDYDFIFYVPFDDSFDYELNRKVEKLSEENIAEIEEYIKLCEPPLELTMAKQYSDDIQESVKNRRTIGFERLGFFKFDNMTEILIASREGSNDPRRQIARRYMEWVDFAHGISERLQEELRKTLDEDLREVEHYLDQMPACPPLEHFVDGQYIDERFNTETLDVEGGQDDLGEDKRAV